MRFLVIALTPIPTVDYPFIGHKNRKNFTRPGIPLFASFVIVCMMGNGNVTKPIILDNIPFEIANPTKDCPRVEQRPSNGIGKFQRSTATLGTHPVHFTVWEKDLPFAAISWVDRFKRRIAPPALLFGFSRIGVAVGHA